MAGTGAPCTATGPACELTFRPKNQTRAFLSSFNTSKRGAFEPSITQTFYSPPLRSCVAWVLHTTKLPAIAKAFTALDSGEPHVSGRWRSLALPVRRARRAMSFADSSEEILDIIMSTSSAGAVGGGVPVPRVGMTLRAVPQFVVLARGLLTQRGHT